MKDIKVPVFIDESLRFLLFGLEVELGVKFEQDECERIFSDERIDSVSAKSYVLYETTGFRGFRVTGIVDEYEPEEIFLTVSGRSLDLGDLAGRACDAQRRMKAASEHDYSSPVRITRSDRKAGNEATAAVLLLYRQLIIGEGFTRDETEILSEFDFGPHFMDVVVVDREQCPEIDQAFLREGAVIACLCGLNDMVLTLGRVCLDEGSPKWVIEQYDAGRMSAVPEVEGLFGILRASDPEIDHAAYKECLDRIFRKYVLGRIKELASSHLPPD